MTHAWSTLILLLLFVAGCAAGHDFRSVQYQRTLKLASDQPGRPDIDYLLFVPQGHNTSPGPWPMILYLHDAGKVGDGPEEVRKSSLPLIADNLPTMPFIIVSPCCPPGNQQGELEWNKRLVDLVDRIAAAHNVDPGRNYVSGYSLGAMGTWRLAAEYPDKFAALMPLAGRYDVDEAPLLKGVPIWFFNGAKDASVKPQSAIQTVAALEKLGSPVRFTLFPEGNHNTAPVYYGIELYEWLLEHRIGPDGKRVTTDASLETTLGAEKAAGFRRDFARMLELRDWAEEQQYVAAERAPDTTRLSYAMPVKNAYDQDMMVTVRWLSAKETPWKATEREQSMVVPAGQSASLELRATRDEAGWPFPIPESTVEFRLRDQLAAKTIRRLPYDSPAYLAASRPVHVLPIVDPAPAIDGELDEPAWQKAVKMEGFFNMNLDADPVVQTWAKACYDRKNLYLAVWCEEPLLQRLALEADERDARVHRDDSIELLLDVGGDGANVYQFMVNANGTIYDALNGDKSYQSNITAAPAKAGANNRSAWQLELAMPWKDLKPVTPIPGTQMRFALVRNRIRKNRRGEEAQPIHKGQVLQHPALDGPNDRIENYGVLKLGE